MVVKKTEHAARAPRRKAHPAGEATPPRAAAKPRRTATRHVSAPPPEIPWASILRAARDRFGIKRFRSGQKELLEEVLSGRSALGLMPTGAGKSLTYQLPALFLSRPVVVVSPLIALMQDQQDHASDAEIVVEKLDSTLTTREQSKAENEIETGIAQLIYVTPERLQNQDFIQSLKHAGGISLLVVDEAHCIPQWGHDFRPAYLAIGDARKALGMPPVLALTATATEEVVTEILDNLNARDARIINTGIERDNLSFSVHPTVNADAKLTRIVGLLQQEEGTGIIYTASVRSADELHTWLLGHGISVGRYHGRMKMREREAVQQAFMHGDHQVMIATKAFGLGVDKPDIRFVYHFEFPDSLESYYQEAGRAGRDGLPSRAVLLYRVEDRRIQSFFLGGRYPKVEELRRVLDAMAGRVFVAPSEPEAEPIEVIPAIKAAAIHDALRLEQELTGKTEARHRAKPEPSDTAGTQTSTLSADAVAERAGLGRRKTQVLLNLLLHAEIIRRGPRGYLPLQSEPLSEDVLTELLRDYTSRAQHDRDRLAEMMHYAETVDCRMQVIRQYFGENAGDRCGHCDNCEQGVARNGHAGRVQADAAAQLRERASPVPAPHHADESHDGGVVTRVETMHGTIMTTAPETLPHSSSEPVPLEKGDSVRHKRFGPGTVRDAHGDVALIRFSKGGERKVKLSFLKRTS